MQDEPNKQAILLGIARFLDVDVRPVVADRALAFRLRIAAHLLGTVVRELGTEAKDDADELASLQRLLGQPLVPEPDADARAQAIQAANQGIVAALASDQLDITDLHEHLERALAARIAVSNPRFDLSPEIE